MTARPARVHDNPPVSQALPAKGVLVLSGYGLRLAVERGHLVVEDGAGADRRCGRFPRVRSGIERIVVLGHSGSVTLEALRWLHEIGAAFVQLGRDGELIASGAPRVLTDVRIRRAQVIAVGNEVGVEIARELLRQKLHGQARVIDDFPGERDVRLGIQEAASELDAARSIDHLRFIESRAAALYWSAWESIPLRFAGRDAKHVPTHWRTAGTRSSPLTAGPRKAATPANALLNYLYSIVEAEARLAALAVGCDPSMGILHADKRYRDSLACDLMEPVRPRVDAYVLRLLEAQTFERADFFETRDGNCRLMPSIARPLATTALQWGKALAPIAERVGAALLHADASMMPSTQSANARGDWRFRTPLTGSNRSRPKHVPPVTDVPVLELPNRCRTCGVDIGRRKRAYCDVCLPNATRVAATKAVTVQRQLRAVGQDRRSDDDVRAKHRVAAREAARLNREWEAEHPTIPSRAQFDRKLRPRLANVPVSLLARVTGLSTALFKQVRRGTTTPHPRHWDAIQRVLAEHEAANRHRPKVPNDPAFFAREIAPHLRALGAERIRDATGLSPSYSRRVLHGHHVPHPMHWAALVEAIRNASHRPGRKG